MPSEQTRRIPATNLEATRERVVSMRRWVHIVNRVLLPVAVFALAACAVNTTDQVDIAAQSPLHATYLIEGQAVSLVHGRCERPAAPDSAIIASTAVLGRPVTGDLGGSGGEDAVVLLTHDPGGSGVFYYLAAAIREDHRYQGSNAVLLGDRIVPRDIKISHRVVVVRYADRRPDEPMSAYPTIDHELALAVENGQLLTIGPLVAGHVTIGHEVRVFQPCNGREALWLMGASPALKEITAAHRRQSTGEKPYRRVFAVLAGKRVAPPIDGFGADYKAAFLATHLVEMASGGNCPRDIGPHRAPAPVDKKLSLAIAILNAVGRFIGNQSSRDQHRRMPCPTPILSLK